MTEEITLEKVQTSRYFLIRSMLLTAMAGGWAGASGASMVMRLERSWLDA